MSSNAGIRKAAMFLMSLPTSAAAELLRAAPPETVTRIAAEMAYLEQAGGVTAEGIQEFVQHLSKARQRPARNQYAMQLLEAAMGKTNSAAAIQKVQELIAMRDPFSAIRGASVEALSEALAGEAPQVAALVLTELPPDKSGKLLAMLDEKVRLDAVRGMTAAQEVSPEARLKVAQVVHARMAKPEVAAAPTKAAVVNRRREQLRKVAVLLRGLEKNFRDTLVAAINQHDAPTANEVLKLMVLWEDLPLAGDRTLQEVLRKVDARKLALALVKCDAAVVKKLRANMSERAAALVEEEASLLSKPTAEDVSQAREQLLDALRAMNAKGELTFEGA